MTLLVHALDPDAPILKDLTAMDVCDDSGTSGLVLRSNDLLGNGNLSLPSRMLHVSPYIVY